MKKKILFAIVLLSLALTACSKDDPAESLKVTEAETKSQFDISEDFENFISESLATPGSALSVMDEEVRVTTEQETEENKNLDLIKSELSQSEVTASIGTKELQTDKENLKTEVEEMPKGLKEAIEAQNNKEVQEDLALINAYLETSQNRN